MTQVLTDWIVRTFDANPFFIVSALSVVPFIETRGAITVGIRLGVPPFIAWILSCLSAFIVCPVLFYGFKPVLHRLKQFRSFRNIAEKTELLFRGKAEKLGISSGETDRKKAMRKKALGVFLFVAVPLPMTGIWTGAIIAAFLDLKGAHAFFALFFGNLVAGLIVTLLNLVLGEYAVWILVLLLVFIVTAIGMWIFSLRKKAKPQ